MPKLISDWRAILISALSKAGIIMKEDKGFTGKIVISINNGGVSLVEFTQTVK